MRTGFFCEPIGILNITIEYIDLRNINIFKGREYMVYYLQRERTWDTAIPSNSIIQFDNPVALSKTPSMSPSEDFQYQDDGSIDIRRPGTYAVFWFVVERTGFARDGQSYHLKWRDYNAPDWPWRELAGSSNHIKVSSTPGFSIVIVTHGDIDDLGKISIALFNTADEAIELTFFQPKAGILIFGIDLDSLERRLAGIDQRITDLFGELQAMEDFIRFSSVVERWSAALPGIGVAVIHSGFTYNFWGIGTLSSLTTLYSGQTYYLLQSSQFDPLMLYQGSSTISTLWIETPTGTMYSIPIRLDATGIYFTPNVTIANLPSGTTFKFTQALILAPS